MIANDTCQFFQPLVSFLNAGAFIIRPEEGGVDLFLVTRIVITEVVDYHGN